MQNQIEELERSIEHAITGAAKLLVIVSNPYILFTIFLLWAVVMLAMHATRRR